ncbi:MAG: 23S rRNA (adenine(2503)-C(2))-methyltransferase RlmN [Candidatus Falkowbacteria bacterium]
MIFRKFNSSINYMNIKQINNFLESHNIPAYRLKQIIKAVYIDSVNSFSEISALPKDLREKMDKEIKILSFDIENVLISDDKKSFKAVLKLNDGNFIETVLMNNGDNWSACVSSQSGCALRCAFCATGASGFKRNLTSEEITDQILFWRQYFKKNNLEGSFLNIVFMGMGEPFMNYENVKKSLKSFTDPGLFNIGARHISVSTSGIADGIKKIAKDFPQVNLAISIISANDKKRSELMPINKKFNLERIRKALDYYFNKTNRKVFLEYIMLKNINDKRKDADDLIKFIKSNSKPNLLHVNLIRYNETESKFAQSDEETITWFKEYLLKNKINTTIRKSLGSEIKAACGQLVKK